MTFDGFKTSKVINSIGWRSRDHHVNSCETSAIPDLEPRPVARGLCALSLFGRLARVARARLAPRPPRGPGRPRGRRLGRGGPRPPRPGALAAPPSSAGRKRGALALPPAGGPLGAGPRRPKAPGAGAGGWLRSRGPTRRRARVWHLAGAASGERGKGGKRGARAAARAGPAARERAAPRPPAALLAPPASSGAAGFGAKKAREPAGAPAWLSRVAQKRAAPRGALPAAPPREERPRPRGESGQQSCPGAGGPAPWHARAKGRAGCSSARGPAAEHLSGPPAVGRRRRSRAAPTAAGASATPALACFLPLLLAPSFSASELAALAGCEASHCPAQPPQRSQSCAAALPGRCKPHSVHRLARRRRVRFSPWQKRQSGVADTSACAHEEPDSKSYSASFGGVEDVNYLINP